MTICDLGILYWSLCVLSLAYSLTVTRVFESWQSGLDLGKTVIGEEIVASGTFTARLSLLLRFIMSIIFRVTMLCSVGALGNIWSGDWRWEFSCLVAVCMCASVVV